MYLKIEYEELKLSLSLDDNKVNIKIKSMDIINEGKIKCSWIVFRVEFDEEKEEEISVPVVDCKLYNSDKCINLTTCNNVYFPEIYHEGNYYMMLSVVGVTEYKKIEVEIGILNYYLNFYLESLIENSSLKIVNDNVIISFEFNKKIPTHVLKYKLESEGDSPFIIEAVATLNTDEMQGTVEIYNVDTILSYKLTLFNTKYFKDQVFQIEACNFIFNIL